MTIKQTSPNLHFETGMTSTCFGADLISACGRFKNTAKVSQPALVVNEAGFFMPELFTRDKNVNYFGVEDDRF